MPLRRQYHFDKPAFLAAFRPSEEDKSYTYDRNIELGMKAFKSLERRLLNEDRWGSYYLAGRRIVKELTGLGAKTDASDYVFLALDFEGMVNHEHGLKEFGVAILDLHDLADDSASADATIIRTENYQIKKHRGQMFLFGETVRTHLELLSGLIIHILSQIAGQGRKKIIIVGHEVQNELTTLEHFGISLQAFLSIVGVLDTAQLSQTWLGTRARLAELLDYFEIPCLERTLHCAGNDAHYTMRVLLAMLRKRTMYAGRHDLNDVLRLETIIRTPLPVRSILSRRGALCGWEDVDVGDALSMMWSSESE